MKFFLYFGNILIFSIIKINCSLQNCYEYSCDECNSPDYGSCTKCRETFTLIDGKCPCSFSSCALCTTGLPGLHICEQCKDGYYNSNNDCYCSVDNCDQCAENGCQKCATGYSYNETSKECIKESEEEKINCYDPNCEKCFSEEEGACENCNEGYYLKKGECLNTTRVKYNRCPDNLYSPDGKYCIEKCSGATCDQGPYIQFVGTGFSFLYLCPANECLVCENNGLKIFSNCDNSKECSSLEGCLNCIDSQECLICQQGYYIIGGICKKCSEGCSICTSATKCEYCMSGYELTPEKSCILTYNFDYNTQLYEMYKVQLIETFYPEEMIKYQPNLTITTVTDSSTETIENTVTETIQTETIVKNTPIVESSVIEEESTTNKDDTEIITSTILNKLPIIPAPLSEIIQNINLDRLDKLIFCDRNCIECYQNKGICQKCDTNYDLIDNKCKLKCSDQNCLDCELKDGSEICNQCFQYYHIKSNKCVLNCNIDHCAECSLSDNNLKCNKCINGYHLDNNICKINCEDNNCNICSDDGKTCIECNTDKKLFNGKCAYNTEICHSKYPHCKYCIEDIGCYECSEEYKINNNKCEKSQNLAPLIIIIIGALLIIIGMISFCCYSRKKQLQIQQMRNEYINQDQTNNAQIYVRNELSGSFRSVINKDDLIEEFEMQKRKMKKGKITCMFCKKKPGKFECDCGCIVCKEHSSLKDMETEGKTYKVCYNCDKIVKKVNPIKYMCNICMQKKMSVVHFKCGCALEVCKECYVKCKMSNNKCPGCRAII